MIRVALLPLSGSGVAVLLLVPLVHLPADTPWTDDDEDTFMSGYQETNPYWEGTRCTVYRAASQQAKVETALVKVGSNAIWFQYEFESDARDIDAVYCDVYQDTDRNTADLSAETYLNFWVRGTVNGQIMKVGLMDSGYNVSSLEPINDWVASNQDISNSEYRAVTVLLSQFTGVVTSSILAVRFAVTGDIADKGDVESLYIDNVYFNGPLAVRWPR